jgi:hypothetical protein
MKIDPDYTPIGSHSLPDEMAVLLLQKGMDFKSAIINRIDLDEMISDGVLLDVDGDPFNIAYVKIADGAL